MNRRRIAVSVFLAVALLGVSPPPASYAARRGGGGIDIRFPTVSSARYRNDYRAARSGGRSHAATDLFAPAGAPVYAAKAGRVVWRPAKEHPTAGFAIWVRDRRGRTYAYYHLGRAGGSRRSAMPRGIREGVSVRRGQVIARVGDSGNAAGGTPHLHFEIHDPAVADPWAGHRRNPYWSLLQAQGRRPHHSVTSRSAPVASGPLRRGSRGPAVTAWQRNLNRVSGARLATDGIFGPSTHAATVRFQRSVGLRSGLGIVGPRSRAAMTRRLDRPARRASAHSGRPLLRRGSTGRAVTRWQRDLNQVGYRLAADGAFGPGTHAATVRFQRAAGLGPRGLGVVGPATRAALRRKLTARSRPAARAPATPLLRQGSRGRAVARWQRQLNRVQRSGLATDGIFGRGTHAATVRFQRSAGLGPRGLGIVGPRTRAALAPRRR